MALTPYDEHVAEVAQKSVEFLRISNRPGISLKMCCTVHGYIHPGTYYVQFGSRYYNWEGCLACVQAAGWRTWEPDDVKEIACE